MITTLLWALQPGYPHDTRDMHPITGGETTTESYVIGAIALTVILLFVVAPAVQFIRRRARQAAEREKQAYADGEVGPPEVF